MVNGRFPVQRALQCYVHKEEHRLTASSYSVVQRQLWLMENKNMSKEQAYDQARREFYRLRHEEDVERRIAQEEARIVGAYFGKNTTQVGMGLEDKSHEEWKKYALEQITKVEAMRSEAYISFGEDETEEAAQGELPASTPP